MKCKQCGAEIEKADAVRTAAVRMRIMMQQRMQYSRMKQDRIYPDRGEDARFMTVIRVKWLHFC